MEWLPGASRASQPERDARQIFTRRLVRFASPEAPGHRNTRTTLPRHVVQL